MDKDGKDTDRTRKYQERTRKGKVKDKERTRKRQRKDKRRTREGQGNQK